MYFLEVASKPTDKGVFVCGWSFCCVIWALVRRGFVEQLELLPCCHRGGAGLWSPESPSLPPLSSPGQNSVATYLCPGAAGRCHPPTGSWGLLMVPLGAPASSSMVQSLQNRVVSRVPVCLWRDAAAPACCPRGIPHSFLFVSQRRVFENSYPPLSVVKTLFCVYKWNSLRLT